MYGSRHTRLLNKFIGLCDDLGNWPAPLAKLGYRVQAIEEPIKLDSARSVVPDVVACSRSRVHAIVAECKGGSYLKEGQQERYDELTSSNVAGVVTIDGEGRLTHVVVYVIHDDSYGRISGQRGRRS